MKIAIYGVFIKDRCIYVGRTSDIEGRTTAHRLRFTKLFNEAPSIRVLKQVSLESSAEFEWSMIRLYKSLGQADFNAEPNEVFYTPSKPKSERLKERAEKILLLVERGHPRKEIALLLGVSETTISNTCRAHGVISVAGRKLKTGVGYGLKINRAQHEEILRRDDANIPHPQIARLFGISRERVRQVCKAAGHPTRQARRAEQVELRVATDKANKERRQILKRLTPTKSMAVIAEMWGEGKTIRQIADALDRERTGMGVQIVRLRKRFPALFPYRRAIYQRHGHQFPHQEAA